MKQRALRLGRALVPTLALVCLFGPILRDGWNGLDFMWRFTSSGVSVNQVIAGMIVAFSIALAMVFGGFLRLRSLSRRIKGTVVFGCLGFALAVGLAFGLSIGGWVALGLTAQLAAGITWSERCHAMLGGRPWQRVAWAVVGVLVPIAVLPATGAGFYTWLYWHYKKTFIAPSAILCAVSLFLLFAAAIHHLRARNRAQEWRLARETGEYPVPTTRPESTR